ncbi:reverse transcriptase domain-containing protein [Tanacetum coccineum]
MALERRCTLLVKYATCTFLGGALTWWNSHVRNVGHDAAYEMSWKSLMKMMTKAYYPRNEIQKLEKMVPDEDDKIANSLMDQKVRVYAARQADNKRRIESNPRDDHVQQLPYKRQNVARAYTAGPGKKKEYAGTLPLYNKCKYHHTRSCTAKCRNCKRIGHQTKDCRSLAATINQRTPVANQRALPCFKCGKQGHYRSECPKLKNQNRENQAVSSEARGRVHALGGGEADQDTSNIADNADA